jgi:hypothetical protein
VNPRDGLNVVEYRNVPVIIPAPLKDKAVPSRGVETSSVNITIRATKGSCVIL